MSAENLKNVRLLAGITDSQLETLRLKDVSNRFSELHSLKDAWMV